jgi:hypothetical protein
MYQVNWIDPKTKEQREMKVSTLLAVRALVNTLKTYNGQYFPVTTKYIGFGSQRTLDTVMSFE